jgi:hypothetical protein
MQRDVSKKSRAKSSTLSKKAAVSKCRPPRPVYALKQWTIERRKPGWYIIATSDRVAGGDRWRGPYCSIVSGSLAIGKQLAAEARERYRRHCAFHRVEDDSGLGNDSEPEPRGAGLFLSSLVHSRMPMQPANRRPPNVNPVAVFYCLSSRRLTFLMSCFSSRRQLWAMLYAKPASNPPGRFGDVHALDFGDELERAAAAVAITEAAPAVLGEIDHELPPVAALVNRTAAGELRAAALHGIEHTVVAQDVFEWNGALNVREVHPIPTISRHG